MNIRATTLGLALMIGLTLAHAAPLLALSVGDIAVQSRRGAPFLAEIPLKLNQRERDKGVSVMLGDGQDYREEGLRRAAVIDRLSVTLRQGTQDVINIFSKDPVQNAAFNLVLLVRSGQVTIVQTYAVKLPGAPAPPPTVARAVTTPVPKPSKRSATMTPSARPKSSSLSSDSQSWQQGLPERYGPVERGKTLYRIVVDLGVPKGSVWQAAVRIWQTNKRQFSGGNLHGLRSGTYLTLAPDLAKGVAAMSAKEAREIVSEQWEKWQAVRRTVQGRQSAVPSRHTSVARAKGIIPAQPKSAPVVEAPPPESEGVPLSVATVVLPTELQPATALAGDLRLVFRGLEEFLAQRLPERGGGDNVTTFVSATELQTALQGLEERLLQQFQVSVEKVTITQQPSGPPPPTLLEELLPSRSMVHVLVLENSLLLLLAVGILWRWYRTRS